MLGKLLQKKILFFFLLALAIGSVQLAANAKTVTSGNLTAGDLSAFKPANLLSPIVDIAPTITCPVNQTTSVTGACNKVVSYSTISTGSPAPTITYVFYGATTGSGSGDGSGATFNVGTTTVMLTATNAFGTANCSFTVTVNASPTPFAISAGSNVTICKGSSATLTASGASSYIWNMQALPLDIVGGSGLAVGLRKLKSSYSGYALQLRRSSDNAIMDFGFNGILLDVAAITTWLGGNDGYCTILYDQSGNGRNITQPNAGNQPLFVANGINGKPHLHFSTWMYMTNSYNFTPPYSVIYGARQTGLANYRVLSAVNNNWLLGWWGGAKKQAYFDGWITPIPGSPLADNDVYVYSATGNGSISSYYENGTLAFSNAGGLTGPNGIELNGGNAGELSDCDFMDVFVFSSVLSDADRITVENTINKQYYGSPITVSPATTTTYSVTGFSGSGCSATSSVTVNVFNPIITPAGPVMICNGGSVTLTATAGTSYLWSTGATTQSIDVTTAGEFSVIVDGCMGENIVTTYVTGITPINPMLCNDGTLLQAAGPITLANFNWGGSSDFESEAYPTPLLTNVISFSIGSTNAHVHSHSGGNVNFRIDLYNPNTNTWVNIYDNNTTSYDGFNFSGLSLTFPTISAVSQIRYTSNPFQYNSFHEFYSVPMSLGTNNNFTYLWNTGATTQIITATTTGKYTVTINGCPSSDSVFVVGPPGNPAVFGTNEWLVYAWNSSHYANGGTSWNTKYAGYYTQGGLNFDTQTQWGIYGSPSDPTGYQGCQVGADLHSWSAKRQGFPCATYQIDIPAHDDHAQLFINGSMVWEHDACCDSHSNVWTGNLDAASTVEFRGTDLSGPSYGAITFTPVISFECSSSNYMLNMAAGECALNHVIPAPLVQSPCGPITVTSDHPNNTFLPGTTVITWTATDLNGNTGTCTSTVIVTEPVPPVISCPESVTVFNEPGLCGAHVAITATATDFCYTPGSPMVTVSSGVQPGGLFPVGTTVNIWTATDASGNTSTCSATITVIDNEAPVIHCQNISVNAAQGQCSAVVNFPVPYVTDNCCGTEILEGYSYKGMFEGHYYFMSNNTTNWSTANSLANATGGKLVVINTAAEDVFLTSILGGVEPWIGGFQNYANPGYSEPGGGWEWVDGTPFTFTSWQPGEPNNSGGEDYLMLYTNGNWNDYYQSANLHYIVEIPCNLMASQISGPESGSTLAVGTHTVVWSTIDDHGNSATCETVITVVDNQPPVITYCPEPTTVNVNVDCMAEMPDLVSQLEVSDNCTPYELLTIVQSIAIGELVGRGDYTVTLTVTDIAGNVSTCSVNVSVVDIIPPVIDCSQPVIAYTAPGTCGAIVNLTPPPFSDNCGDIAVDATLTFNYTGDVQTFTAPYSGNYTLEAWGAKGGDITSYYPIEGGLGGYATGSIFLSIGQTINIYVGEKGQDRLGNHPYSDCTYVPGGWNGGGATRSRGTSTPGGGASDIRLGGTGLADRILVAGGGGGGGWTYAKGGDGGGLTGQDGTQSYISYTGAQGGTQFSGGTYGYSGTSCSISSGSLGQGGDGGGYTAGGGGGGGGYYGGGGGGYADGGGGGSSYIGGVIAGSTTQGVNNSNGIVTVHYSIFESSTIAQTGGILSGTSFPKGTSVVEWTATDASGNSSTCTQMVTVIDGQPPVISNCPQNVTVTYYANDPLNCQKTASWTPPTANDLCDGPVSIVTTSTAHPGPIASGAAFPVGVTVVTFTATDAQGNTSTCTMTVTVLDGEAPTITCPGNVSTCPNANNAPVAVNGIAPTQTYDHCSSFTVSYTITGATTGSGITNASGTLFNVGDSWVTYKITDANNNTATCSFKVTIWSLPTVTFTGTYTDIALCTPPFLLTGGQPAGGTYSGAGVSANYFYANIATPGPHVITYTYTDGHGCSNSTTFTVNVALPLATTYTVGAGGNFPSLTGPNGLFYFLNTTAISSNIIAQVLSNLTEPGTYALNPLTLLNACWDYTLTVVPYSASEKVISGAVAQAMIRLNGADRVTFDGTTFGGKHLRIKNLDNTQAALLLMNGATTNTFKGCIFEGSNSTLNSGIVLLGSSTGPQGNSNNNFSGNVFRNRTDFAGLPANLFCSDGSPTYPNSTNTIMNNEGMNFSQYGMSITSNGNGSGWTISGNSLYFTYSPYTTANQTGFNFVPGSTSINNMIYYNFFGGSGPNASGAQWINPAIGTMKGFVVNAGDATVSGNTTANIKLSNTGVANYTGLELQAGTSLVLNNVVGSPSAANSLSIAGTGAFFGINATSTSAVTIRGNTIANITYTGTTAFTGAIIKAIHLKKGSADKNKIHSIGATSSNFTPTLYGISNMTVLGSTGNTITNNMIALNGGNSNKIKVYGIYDQSAAIGGTISNNTVSISGIATASQFTAAFYRIGIAPIILYNNILVNTRPSNAAAKHYAIYVNSTPSLQSNYNDLYTASLSLGYWGGSILGTLPAWVTATTLDANSINILPVFMSPTDLHLSLVNVAIDNKGTTTYGTLTDIDGTVRSLTTPDVGAHEFTAVGPRTDFEEIVLDKNIQSTDMKVYPNPFSQFTTIEYIIPEDQSIKIAVYNYLGEQVAMIESAEKSAGTHSISFDAGNLPNGMYLVRMQAGNNKLIVKRIQVIR